MINIRLSHWAMALSLIIGPLLAMRGHAEIVAPQLGSVSLAQPLPLPYGENTHAMDDVNAALERAGRTGKRVIVDLGGNWCPDCRVFAAVMALPELRAFVDDHFDVVVVNVGRFTTNLDVPARFGVAPLKYAPTILILSPEGEVLNREDIADLKDARAMSPQAVADWLAHWAAP